MEKQDYPINFEYTHFNLDRLIELKESQGIRTAVVIPTKNEEETIGRTLEIVKQCGRLVDQIMVSDSGSTDNTLNISSQFNDVKILRDESVAKSLQVNLGRGKGFNLWAATYFLKDNADVVSYLDADIKNIDPRFVYATVGALLENPHLLYVKGRYQRPETDNRVTRLVMEPILSMHFPEVMQRIIQPLCGQFAGRMSFLENVKFTSGYSIESNLIIRAIMSHLDDPQERVGQVYLGELKNREWDAPYLGEMSSHILYTIYNLAQEFGRGGVDTGKLGKTLIQWTSSDGITYSKKETPIGDLELPPVSSKELPSIKLEDLIS